MIYVKVPRMRVSFSDSAVSHQVEGKDSNSTVVILGKAKNVALEYLWVFHSNQPTKNIPANKNVVCNNGGAPSEAAGIHPFPIFSRDASNSTNIQTNNKIPMKK